MDEKSSAIGKTALRETASKSTKQFALKRQEQGTASLEILAKGLIESAYDTDNVGRFGYEEKEIYSKFIRYRQRFYRSALNGTMNGINQDLLR